MYAPTQVITTPIRSAVRSPMVSLAPYTMYESPPAKSAKPSIISQIPPKLRATRNSMIVMPLLLPKVTWGGEWHSIRQSAMKTMTDTMTEEITWPMSPHQLTSR